VSSAIDFYKYVGAGNDFIIFQGWDGTLELTSRQIVDLCDRRSGIGADGVMILQSHDSSDFKMNYFNADGSRGEMCGNGARCLVSFARLMGRVGSSGTFSADDGIHHFKILDDLIDVEIIVNGELGEWNIPRAGCGFIDTGVPHLIIPESDVSTVTLDPLGWEMNEHEAYPQGTNVNIIEN